MILIIIITINILYHQTQKRWEKIANEIVHTWPQAAIFLPILRTDELKDSVVQ